MPGRMYSCQFSGSAATVQVDFFEIAAPATRAIEIMSVHLSQGTEIADAAEEMLLVLIKSGQTVSGSGGAAGTAVPRAKGSSAAASALETMNTTKANTGTIVTHFAQYWNIRVPLDIIFTPETTIMLPPSERLTIELGTTPADSITFAGTLVFYEHG